MFIKFSAFKKKDEFPSLIISEIIDSERGGYLNVQKSFFRIRIGSQRVYDLQTRLKSSPHHFDPIFPLI